MKDKAFELIFREHNRMITVYLSSLLGDDEWALDLTQEVFLVAYQKMGEFDASHSLAAWLRGIARNLARNKLRREKNLKYVLVEGNEIDRIFSVFDSVESNLVWEERLEILDRCIERLPDKQRQVVDKFYLLGEKSVKNIAAFMGVLETSIYQLMWSARRNLRKCVESLSRMGWSANG